MPRDKLIKFELVTQSPFVIEHKVDDAKKEMESFLNGANIVLLELGCGRGHYTLELARKFPDARCVGVDIQGERLWYGAEEAKEEKLDNVRFLRIDIRNLKDVLSESSIDDIWITFPDPHPKDKHAKRRLTGPRFLKVYKKLLKTGGSVHLKTDSKLLYEYSKYISAEFGAHILNKIDNVDIALERFPLLKIQTHFEKKHRLKGRTIHYLNLAF